MTMSLPIVMIEKHGICRQYVVKDFRIDQLYKKCGFKKAQDFVQQHEWLTGDLDPTFPYGIVLYGKVDDTRNSNTYEFPPPVDTKPFFGTCAFLAFAIDADGNKEFRPLLLSVWEKVYTVLHGGFEDLGSQDSERSVDTPNQHNDDDDDEDEENELILHQLSKTKSSMLPSDLFGDEDDDEDDDEEEDEALDLPASKRTRHGYEKDGFVVDDDDDEEEDEELEEEAYD